MIDAIVMSLEKLCPVHRGFFAMSGRVEPARQQMMGAPGPSLLGTGEGKRLLY